MKKSDLKNGAIVELRNGSQYIVKDNRIYRLKFDWFRHLDNFNDDLTYKNNKDIDIVKVDNSNHLDTNWTWERPQENILTDKEKEYLRYVIKSIKDKVNYICKTVIGGTKYININYSYNDKNNADMYLYYFKENIQFDGMKLDEEYTLKKLGLE